MADTTSLRRGEEGSYLGDQPVRSKPDDRFNRWPFAQRLADTIARRSDPSSLVIGIYGVWGDGKTSVLYFMEEVLKTIPDVILIPFNPWHFKSETQLLQGFFDTLAEALDKKLASRTEKVGNFLKKYGSILSLPGIITGGSAEGVTQLGESLSTVELGELRRRVEAILKETQKRVVVLIDDIDRLDRQEIQTIFKLVKLSAGFEYTVYVLAFDDEIVAAALGEKYGQGGADAGRNFLEKIIQVPLHLPPADRLSLRKMTFEGVNATLQLSDVKLAEGQPQAFVRHFIDGLEPRLVTPRQVKRYTNALMFALPLLKGEVHPVDQMLLEGIRVFYPKLYTVIRDRPDMFLPDGSDRHYTEEAQAETLEMLAIGLKGLDPLEQKAATNILQVLFPRLKRGYEGPDWDRRWAQEQRICSEWYFSRYFHYATSEGDVPDQAVAALIRDASTASEGDIETRLRDLAGNGKAAHLVQKLWWRGEALESQPAKTLALAMARNGTIFPKDEQLYSLAATFYQAAILVMKLVKRSLNNETRAALARQILREAEPLPFAVECLRWFRRDATNPESEQIVSTAVEQELGECLADRIRKAAMGQPPYIAYPDASHTILWVWHTYGAPGAVEAYLKARLAADPSEAMKLLGTYVPTAINPETGLVDKSTFGREAYDAITQMVDPTILYTHVASLYRLPRELNESVFHTNLPFEERVAQQFAYVHQQVKASLSATGNTV